MATTTKAEPAGTRKVDVRQAAQAAMSYFFSLFPGFSCSLEEVDLSEDENYWLITLGFEATKRVRQPGIEEILNPPRTKYKVFKVDVRSGEVRAMKIRSLG